MGRIVALTLGEQPLARGTLPDVYEQARALLARERPALLRCEAGALPADALSAEAIARVALAARRHGCPIEVRGASRELAELLSFMGLDDALATASSRRP